MWNSYLLRASAMAAGLVWTLAANLAWSADSAQPPPNPNEAHILAALDDKTELEFVDQPLSDVIDYLKQRHGIEIQVDHKALTDAGLGSDTPITKHVRGIRLESALDLMLDDLDLTFLVRDEVMFITSKQVAENLLTAKTYPVADLVAREAGAEAEDDYCSLMELITSSVGPSTWNEVGGPGSIHEFRNSRALVILQTFAVHREIERLLASVRAVRQEQASAAPKQADDEVQDNVTLYVKVYRLPQAWAHPAPATQAPVKEAAPAGEKPGDNPAPKEVLPQFGMGGGMGMGGPRAATSRWPTAGELAVAIPAVVSPESWNLSGAPGAIRAAGNSLIVRQTRPVHREIARLLEQLK